MGIRAIRKRRGLSQEDLSAKSGVNRISISKYERGASYPNMANAMKIANALGCKIDQLFDYTDGNFQMRHEGGEEHGTD